MVKHTQTIRRQIANKLFESLEGLSQCSISMLLKTLESKSFPDVFKGV